MRLLRIHLRQFMGVRDREVVFAPAGVTVVEGPNESGKTTLMKAFDLLLEALDSSTASKVREAQSQTSGAGPWVEAEFLTGGHRVVYTKRWLAGRETHATITAPDGRVRNLSGREAHDQVGRLVEDTTDLALWRALRLGQEDPTALPDVGGSPSLRDALDRAAGGQLGGQGEQTLLRRAEDERRLYLTDHGRPTGAYREAQEALARAEAERDEARARADEARAVVARIEQDRARLGEVVRDLEQAEADAQRARQAAQAVERARASVREVTETNKARAAEAELAAAALGARQALARDAQTAAERRDALALAARKAAEQLESLNRSAAEARRADADARAALLRAERQARAAEDGLRRAQLRTAVTAARRQLDDARRIESDVAEVDRQIAANPIDETALARLVELDGARVRAEARLDAGAARLRIEAERDLAIAAEGQSVPLATGAAFERVVSDRLELEVVGVVRIAVEGGGSGARLARAVEDARQALDDALERLGVTSLAEARTRHAERSGLEARRRELAQALERTLGGESLSALEGRWRSLQAQLDADVDADVDADAERDGANESPMDEPQRKAWLDAARDAAERARTVAEQRRGELEGLERQLVGHKERHAASEEQARQAADEAEEFARRLAAAREQASDEALADAAETKAAQRRGAEQALAQAMEALNALDPDTVDQARRSADGRRSRLEAENTELNRRLHHDEGYLGGLGMGDEGVSERLSAAEADVERAERALAQLRARAEAADCLFTTLERHRSAALKAYREPYRAEVERLGRLVFGREFGVVLDDALRIEQRRLDGVTLPVGQLSTGAKEQLAVVARLACARLVADEGAPVVLDDAFSYSDPERLAGICLALDRVGEDHQVVLLTCTPDRYRQLGSAAVVRLERPSPAADLAPTPAPGPALGPTPKPTPGPAPAADNGEDAAAAERAVLLVLGASGRELGKQEILAAARVTPSQWPRTIRALVDSGRVVQVGERRGARYRLARAPQASGGLGT
jgi:uncharacterized protein YhaN